MTKEYFSKRHTRLILLLGIVIVAAIFFPAQKTYASTNFKMHFIDVGAGDGALLQYGEGSTAKYALIDGGPKVYTMSDGSNVDVSERVHSYLKSLGVNHLEFILVTHPHRDHIGGLISVLKDYSITIDKVYGNPKQLVYAYSGTQNPLDTVDTEFDNEVYQEFMAALQAREDSGGLQYVVPTPGDTVTLGSARITFFGPLDTSYIYGRSVDLNMRQVNKYSIVCKVTYGSNSFLMTGDAQKETFEEILAAGFDVSAQVLKVPHHGYNDVTDEGKVGDYVSDHAFAINHCNPYISVISNGYMNKGGTPYKKVLRDLNRTNVYMTSDHGNIVITSNGQSLSVTTQKGSGVPSYTAPIDYTSVSNALVQSISATNNAGFTLKPYDATQDNTYKLYANKAVTVNLSAVAKPITTITSIEYKFVPKGVVQSAVSYTTGSKVTVKNGNSGRIYVRVNTTMGSVTVKLPGFTVDTKAPTKTTVKANKSGIKLRNKAAKITYTAKISGNLKLKFSADFGISKKQKIEYKIVPKGKKASNYKWKKGNSVTYTKKNRKVRIYVRYTDNAGNVTIRKTKGFYLTN